MKTFLLLILACVSANAATLIVQWDPVDENERVLEYRVYYAQGTNDFALVQTVKHPQTTAALTVTTGQHRVKVRSATVWGEGSDSDGISRRFGKLKARIVTP